tara:strand:- start:44 stop:523 length:480 start_codon:yes stop_codon:yes gene_type:complete
MTTITTFLNEKLNTTEANWAQYSEYHAKNIAAAGDLYVSDSGLVAMWKHKANTFTLVEPVSDTKGNYLHTKGKLRGIHRPAIHQVVWDTFGTGPVAKGMVIDHISEDKQNNHIDNLQLLTIGENVSKSMSDGRNKGDGNPNSLAKKALKVARLSTQKDS